MNCPFCDSSQIRVVNSRSTISNTQIWRRRKCTNCGENFSTYERINLSYLIVIKRSGVKQKYSRAKLYSGIYHSTLDRKHADRGQLSLLSENITSEVERTILNLHKKVVSTEEIKDIVLQTLSIKSPDSFLRYVAHRNSDDIVAIKRSVRRYLKNF